MNFTNEQIEKAIEALPLEFQEAIADSYISNKSLEIGKKYSLLIDKVGKLQDDTMLAVLGLIPGEALAETLIKDLEIDDKQSKLIVHDINEMIFGEIRKKIRERLEQEKNEELETAKKEEKEEEIDRDELLKGIEDPEPAYLKTKDGQIVQTSSKPEISIENTNVNAQKTEVNPTQNLSKSSTLEQKVGEIPKNTNVITAVKKVDPYREPI